MSVTWLTVFEEREIVVEDRGRVLVKRGDHIREVPGKSNVWLVKDDAGIDIQAVAAVCKTSMRDWAEKIVNGEDGAVPEAVEGASVIGEYRADEDAPQCPYKAASAVDEASAVAGPE